MNPLIDLLRHGDTGHRGFRGRLDDALSERGWQQMRAAVEGRGDWRRIVSSPLQRCLAFAQELAQEQAIPCVIEPGLAELDFGAWEGLDSEAVLARDEEALTAFWQDPWRHAPTGGERMADFAARVFAALSQRVAEVPRGRTLVVTHAGVIRLCLARAGGLPMAKLAAIEVPHASLHTIALDASWLT